MSKSEDADSIQPPSEKKSRKVIKPDSETPAEAGDDVSDGEVNEINESLKELDASLGSDDIKKVEDGGNNMPRLVSSDGEDLETPEEDDDILDGDAEPINDKVTEPLDDESEEVSEESGNDDEAIETKKQSEEKSADEEKKPHKDHNTDEDGIPDDPEIDKAVKEIVAEESDAVLAAEDSKSHLSASGKSSSKNSDSLFGKIAAFWATKKGKRWILGGVFGFILLIILIPYTRYLTLNTLGVRSSMQVRVIDGGTLQPIKNVSVKAGGADGLTNEEGVAVVSGVKLGRTNLQIDKRAFATIDQAVTIGWGSNPLGEYQVEAVGSQYTVIVKDFLSGEPIAKAQASSGDGNATSDENGEFVITLDTAQLDDSAEITIDIEAENYRTEALSLTVNNRETQEVELVPSRKHVYVSKRSGKYDVYTAYIDGKGEDKIVGGTGLERDDIALIPHQDSSVAAFVSTRENARNASGYLLSTLYVIDTETGEITKIDQSEKIQVIGWSDQGRLVYVKIAAGASGTDPKRHRIMSFDSKDFAGFKELASSNSFNDVAMAENKVYFAPSNVFQENPEPGTFVIDPTGDNKYRVLDKETFSIVRADYNTFYLSTGNDWFKYSSTDGGEAKPAQAPSSQASRVYFDNPDGNTSAWIDERDGKGVLISHNKDTGEETVILSKNGLKLPMYWLNSEYLVYRVFDGVESADYALSVNGGKAKKIIDVTNTSGINRWFYY